MTLRLGDLQELADEIRHLVQAGLPLEQTLAAAGSGRGERLKEVAGRVESRLKQGESLQDILQDPALRLPRILTAAVGAGVQTGNLELTIELMGDYAADVVSLRSRLVQSAAYPLLIVGVACGMMILVIQHFLEAYRDSAAQLRLPIDPILATLLEWNYQAPWWVLLIPVSLVLVVFFWFISGRASALSFRGPERLLLLIPGVAALVRDLQNYTLTRMLSLLTGRGMAFPEALVLSGSVSGNRSLENGCREIAALIQKGTLPDSNDASMVQASRKLPSLLRAGLKQVSLDESRMKHRFEAIADFYRQRFDRNMIWAKLIMPIAMFIVVAGTCALGYSLLVFWPVTELYEKLSELGVN